MTSSRVMRIGWLLLATSVVLIVVALLLPETRVQKLARAYVVTSSKVTPQSYADARRHHADFILIAPRRTNIGSPTPAASSSSTPSQVTVETPATPVTISSSPPTSVLSQGARNSDVLYLKNLLMTIGIELKDTTDFFDDSTAAAVRRFQAETAGLRPPDGVVGPQTWQALVKAARHVSGNQTPNPVSSTSPPNAPSTAPRTTGATATAAPLPVIPAFRLREGALTSIHDVQFVYPGDPVISSSRRSDFAVRTALLVLSVLPFIAFLLLGSRLIRATETRQLVAPPGVDAGSGGPHAPAAHWYAQTEQIVEPGPGQLGVASATASIEPRGPLPSNGLAAYATEREWWPRQCPSCGTELNEGLSASGYWCDACGTNWEVSAMLNRNVTIEPRARGTGEIPDGAL